MEIKALLETITTVLDEKKGQNIIVLDVIGKSTFTDYMIVVSGTSTRHLKSLSDYVIEKVNELGIKPLGVEGDQGSDWVLLDLGDIIIHIMTEQAREYYQLEKLWSVPTSGEAVVSKA